MKVVKEEVGPTRTPIDYNKLADFYNSAEIGGAVEMDEQVYNITLFKKALSRRDLELDVDFTAFNKDGKTLVKRLSQARMTKD
ncbi:hypothetical protein HOV23_gp053 [Pseudomonas phage Lana]|uniref:Uncharacterized protein n=1 Tax=Pseudomonas phage Lana TaxID=2530172 RepID=A0A481W6Y9_9CAUD|nr:hypothetical protein HOV23_gp053 [Pseudomonas phage Lana]QBJ04520.1 hypothetical protein [Pseudomonas phage Lana]